MSDSDDNNSADNSDQQYTVIDQSYGQDNDDHDSNSKHHRRSRRRESSKMKKHETINLGDDSDDDGDGNSIPGNSSAGRYEEDEDYHEPGSSSKKKRTSSSTTRNMASSSNSGHSDNRKKSKKSKSSSSSSSSSSKHQMQDSDTEQSMAVEDCGSTATTSHDDQQSNGQRLPPLKIKLLPPREKSKRSSKRNNRDNDDSIHSANDDDDFQMDSHHSTSNTRKSSSKSSVPDPESSTTPNIPTRRSERIFVSNAKKGDTIQDNAGETGDGGDSGAGDELEPDFKIIHKDVCNSCRQSGELILCDYCPRAYHKVCLDDDIGANDELPDDWCCPHCQTHGKPTPKELKQQVAAIVAKKKKKQMSAAAKSQQSTPQQPSTYATKAVSSSSKEKEIENRDYCEICNQCGELLLCDTCPRAYHLVCMDEDMKNIPEGQWSCPYCREHGVDASNAELETSTTEKSEKVEKIVCKSCRQSGGDIVFCGSCNTRIHIQCLNPPLDEMPEVWNCLACSVEPLKGKVQRIITWRWKKINTSKEDEMNGDQKTQMSAEDTTKNLLKNLKNRKPREREFFVKWKDMSYWHCSWIDEAQLQVFHSNMYRFYAQKNDMTNPPMFDEAGMLTTNLSEPKSIDDLGRSAVDEEQNNKFEDNPAALAASIASKHRRRKRCSNLPSEIEETYVRNGVRPEWLLIHRIVNHRKNRGKIYYLIKWRDLSYEEVTAEPEPENCDFEIPDYQKKIDEYWNLRRLIEEETAVDDEKLRKSKDRDGEKHRKKDKHHGSKKMKHFGAHPKTDPKKKLDQQPEYIPEPLKLHDYQMEGISWLRYSWVSGIDTILADEMGLGKTIQTVSFLYSLYKEGHSRGPFLIAAPLSTIINWERELEDWAPDFYVVNYTGNKDSRIIIRENELSFDADVIRSANKATRIRKHVPVKFHVLLTSYELINLDSALLGSIDWKVLVVDEAHRLKSNQSLFFRTLNQYSVGHKLLLTGTPLQNNLEELFNLLNFLSPDRFNDMDGFLNEFADIAKEEQVKKLHELLGPHLLRRLKADVLTGMPAKSEFIIRVDLAPLQKKYYKYILTRNFDALNSKFGGKQVSLLNIVMDLKKCCNHPYLFPVAAEEAPKTKLGYFEGSPLVKASGKLIVLQKMLRKLKEDGHRVLIFSQMTQMLDVLEDFLEAEGYKFERIDGGVTGSVRQEAIDRFNAPGAKQFVFLLSTRAGGLGINLATADTVVIYDSDWNPHNDIQALSRAHRIGQTNKVMIYRFVTRNSVEERITQVAKKKMMLTHLVVRPGLGSNKSNATMSKQELDDILKFGTEELFKEEETKESEMIHYDDKAIDGLLDRTQEGIEQKEMWANEYLSSFKVANYVTKEAEEVEEELEEVVSSKQSKDEAQNDPHYWEKLLGAHYLQYQENITRSLGKGKRVRKQVNYLDSASGQNDFQNQESSESSDFSVPSDASENDEDFDERSEGRNQKFTRSNKNTPAKEKMPPLLSSIGQNTEVLGFTPKHRKIYLDLVMRFGLPNLDYNLTDSQFFIRELKNKPEKHLRAYTSLFINHLCEPGDDPAALTFEDGVPKEGLNVSQVLSRIGIISLIKRKVCEYEAKNGSISMPNRQAKTKPKQEPSQTVCMNSNEKTAENQNQTNGQSTDNPTDNEPKPDVDNKIDAVKSEAIPVQSDNNAVESNADDKNVEVKKEDDGNEKMDIDQQPSTTDQKSNTNDKESSNEIKEENNQNDEEDQVRPFEFNIQDGGFTELHTLWYFEEKELQRRREHDIWNRRHDYWLLAGIVKHGYERWHDITNDEDFSILNEPFKNSGNIRDKFMERRLRLLEQALVFEEQLRRFAHLANQATFIVAGEEKKPEKTESNGHDDKDKNGVDEQTETKDQKSDEKEKDSESTSENVDQNKENEPSKNLNPILQRASNHLEDLLIDMKSDCARIPQTVQRIPSIANRLQLAPRTVPSNSSGQHHSHHQPQHTTMLASNSLLSSNHHRN
ncbi:chromodomain-helicase-DNA-binding protein 4-like isoform X2 [Dermatophagoides pteronyssinus]|uniref:chromodomain-helicase-DNA-binding protein 4-like isoform X2 n=1 Tax=Dermatophagoides pteronyssinus TaxID=6956 RepID=UPI003F66480C